MNKTEYGLGSFFSGYLIDDFIEEYLQMDYQKRIEIMLEEELQNFEHKHN
jgi:hypothetical protein